MNAKPLTESEVHTLTEATGLKVLRPTVKDLADRLLATTAFRTVGASLVFHSGEPTAWAVLADMGHGRRSWMGLGPVRAAQAYLRGDIVRRVR